MMDNDALDARILREIPDEARELYQRLLAEPPRAGEELRGAIEAHLAAIREAARSIEFLPLEMAEAIAAVSLRLLAELDGLAPRARRHAVTAMRYFTLDDDAESDTSSVTGLDDDAHVMNAVLDAIGRPEWKVELI